MRYGTFLYGGGATGAVYGTAPVVTTLLWTFMIDWDGDGYYSGENEAVYMVDLSLSRGRDHFIETGGGGFERYSPGKATIILDNTNGRFNPFNVSSPLYPHVTPGKPCRILVQEGSGGTNHGLMRGRIADIQPYNQGNRKMVKIDVIDGQQFLRDRTVRIGYRKNSYPGSPDWIWTAGKWVDLILERAGWPENEWPKDDYDAFIDYAGNEVEGFTENFFTQLTYAWFWNRDAMQAIRELENVEIGTFLHDRSGNVRFLSQHFTLDQIVELDQSQILRDISTPQPWEALRNRIEVAVSPIALHEIDEVIGIGSGTELLWKTGGIDENAIFIRAETSFVVDAAFRWQNFNNIVPANIFIDFEVRANIGGTGADLTSQCVVTYSELANGATITLQNNSASNGYIIDLSLYGDAIYAEFSSLASAEDAESIALYGTRTFRLESPWMQAPDYAQEVADFLLGKLKDPTQYPTVKVENRSDIQFDLDLYVDVIHLTVDELSINSLYRIGKIEHSWLQPTGQATLTTLKLEPYFAVGASSEINNLLSPFDSAAEVDGVTPPADERMLWTLDDTWEYGTGEGNPTGSLRHYLLNPVGFLDKMAETDTGGHIILEGEYFSFDYIWIPSDGFGTIGGTNLIRVEINTVELGLPVNETYSPSNYNVWQTATFDLTEYAGDTIANIRFIRAAGAGVGTVNPRILFDNVFIGR